MPRLREDPAQRICNAVEPKRLAESLAKALAARHVQCEVSNVMELGGVSKTTAFATGTPLTPSKAKSLAPLCREAALNQRPIVALVPARFENVQEACAWAYLRGSGAILCPSPDVWLESLVLLSCFGIVPGPKTAIIAPQDSWLSRDAAYLEQEAEHIGARFSPVGPSIETLGRTDVVLVESDSYTENRSSKFFTVPLVGRTEHLGERPALVGLRAALAAIDVVGTFSRELENGLGPDDGEGPTIDHGRIEKQWSKLESVSGDHETKVMLAAAGIAITRQAVATTPSAAVGKAKKVGFPVEIKPWTNETAAEGQGCPLETELFSAAEVRRAFAAISAALDVQEAPVIVREKPPHGRPLYIKALRIPELGPFVVLKVPGVSGPVTSPAPLRSLEALRLAHVVASSRSGEAPPDRIGLSELLRRVSFLISTSDIIAEIELSKVVVGSAGDQTVVVDGRARRLV